MKQTKTAVKKRWLLVGLIILVMLGMAAGLFIPWNISGLAAHPRPAQNYAEAVQRIEALPAFRATNLNPVCRVQFLTHGQKVERAVVFVHGFTNCPQQFRELGQRFYDLGYNVLIVPQPHQGLANRLTDELSQLTAEELAAYADEMVDIAQGLGAKVTMVGTSAGGVTTSWAAQTRRDIDLAVVISPAFGFKQVPTPLTAPVMNLFSVLPESYEWWDSVLKDKGGLPHAYPRYSRRGLAQTLRLGFAVQAGAQQVRPAARSILVVTNANDASVNNGLIAQVATNWREHGANLTTYEFEAALQLNHDLIDPAQPDQRIDIVYPRLIDLITAQSD